MNPGAMPHCSKKFGLKKNSTLYKFMINQQNPQYISDHIFHDFYPFFSFYPDIFIIL
jgi:hypothetical protein